MSQQRNYKSSCATLSQKNLYLGLSILLWFLVGARANVQNDTWWHLRSGRLIFNTHSVPIVDSYSWVLGDHAQWPNHEWLSQLLFYLLFTLCGPGALHILVASLFATAAAFFFHAMRGRYEVRALILTALLPWIATASAIRPHAFTLTFTAVTLHTLLSRRFWSLPIVLLAWVQFHGGVCFGGLLLLAALLATFITERALFPRLLVVVALAGIGVAINPLGIDIYTHPFRSTAMARVLPLIEWAPPNATSPLGQIFWIAALCMCILVVVQWRRLKCWEVAVLVVATMAVFPLAARHVRNVYLWMPIASVTATHLLLSGELPKHVSSIKYLVAITSSAAAVLLLSVLSVVEGATSSNWHPVSDEVVNVLESTEGPLFNTYDTGAYLIWFVPKRKVFIDSRQDPYPLALLEQTIEVQRSGDFTDFFAGFGFTTAVVEPQMPLARTLVASGWNVAARSPAFFVLVAPNQIRGTSGE